MGVRVERVEVRWMETGERVRARVHFLLAREGPLCPCPVLLFFVCKIENAILKSLCVSLSLQMTGRRKGLRRTGRKRGFMSCPRRGPLCLLSLAPHRARCLNPSTHKPAHAPGSAAAWRGALIASSSLRAFHAGSVTERGVCGRDADAATAQRAVFKATAAATPLAMAAVRTGAEIMVGWFAAWACVQ